MLQALARDCGALCERLPRVPTMPTQIGAAVAGRRSRPSDLVLVIAGSSRGRADHTAGVLERHGELVAHGVALRPGASGRARRGGGDARDRHPRLSRGRRDRVRALRAAVARAPARRAARGRAADPRAPDRRGARQARRRGLRAARPERGPRPARTRCRRAARAEPCAAWPARTRCSAPGSRTACCRRAPRSKRACCAPGRASTILSK